VALLPARGTFLAQFFPSRLGDKIFSYPHYELSSNADIQINSLSLERSYSQTESLEISTYSVYQVSS
jgi:hypothetical protein